MPARAPFKTSVLFSFLIAMAVVPAVAHSELIGAGTQPRTVVLGDLNEDGYLDLISGNADSVVSIHIGRGNRTYDPRVNYSCGATVAAVAVADVNGDGHLDVISGCPSIAKIGVRFGNGDGTLGARVDYTGSPNVLATGDINNDGRPDILYINNGGGTFGRLLNLGSGAFGPTSTTGAEAGLDLAVGDFDNDGNLDVVTANSTGIGLTAFKGNGNGTFQGAIPYSASAVVRSVAVAYINNDGYLDLAVATAANTAVVKLNNGDGTFGANTAYAIAGNPTTIKAADLNGDGRPDLVSCSGPGGNVASVLLNTGTGTFGTKVDYPAGNGNYSIAIGELDVLPSVDLAVTSADQNSINVMQGFGNGTFDFPVNARFAWTNTTGGFNDPNSWYPPRNAPTTGDILVFNRGGSFGVVGVSGTVGQIVVSGGTSCSFSATGFSTGTLNVIGAAGIDLAVERSSTLSISSFVAPVICNIAFGAVAEINGDVIVGGSSNRLQSVNSSGIIFQSTGRAFLEAGSSPATTTPFGNGTGSSALNSVRFLYGSQCIANTTTSIFGAAAPNAVTVLGPGSRYVQNVAFSPDVSGRTYGDFEYHAPGTGSVLSGSGPLQVDSLIVSGGTLSSTMTGTITIRGNIAMGCGFMPSDLSDLEFLPATPMTVRLAGSARQYMRTDWNCAKTELFYMAPNVTLNIDNPAGVEFLYGFRTAANLSFTHGNVSARRVIDESLPVQGLIRYRVVLDSTATLTGAGSSTGWVACPLMRRVTANGTIRMDVGDSLSYQPVDMTLHGVTGPGYVLAASAAEDHWQVSSAQLDLAHLAHRSWMLWACDSWLGPPGTFLSSVDAVLPFAAGDLSAGADPLQFVTRMHNSSQGWLPTTTGVRTATSIQVLGLTASALSMAPEFQAGQSITPSMSVQNGSASEGNGPVPNRVQPLQAQSGNSLTFRVRLSQAAVAPITVDYQTVDGTATVADGDYTPVSGTLHFAPGDTALDIVVLFGADATLEHNETFGLTLANPGGDVTIATPAATGTILDDDDLIAPTATVIYPNGGEFILQNQQVNLQWNASDNFAVNSVDLYIVRGAAAEALQIGYPNTGSYLWSASGAASNKVRFRVVAHDDAHATTDNSNANWELSAFQIGVDEDAPLTFALPAPAPNPAPAGRNRITFAVPHEANVKLTIHDLQGRTMAKLVDGPVPAGRHERVWDASRASAGVYFVRFEAPGFHAERRLVVVR